MLSGSDIMPKKTGLGSVSQRKDGSGQADFTLDIPIMANKRLRQHRTKPA